MTSNKDLAIKSALTNDWSHAVEFNQQILEDKPTDISTLNRLAFAYVKLGEYGNAKKTYEKVLEVDRTNPIAMKNLKKIEMMSGSAPSSKSTTSYQMPDVFIEEAGKTKTIDLINLADKKTLSIYQPGDNVQLVIKRSKIFIQDGDKKYLGMLPDSISVRLINFMKGGNEYSACIKAIDDKTVKVFVKEIHKATRFKNQPSFFQTPTKTK